MERNASMVVKVVISYEITDFKKLTAHAISSLEKLSKEGHDEEDPDASDPASLLELIDEWLVDPNTGKIGPAGCVLAILALVAYEFPGAISTLLKAKAS
ncbi:hypothetical protein [Citreimonas salinaria]|uniref:hypothetical protein n=1 Tax=Citreimonas salinaria TaxID=321339 RepID=UPI00115FCE44|nr:hypothetical protein [Citreimonas salinaria]